jgi:hypothetical protein
MPSAGLRPVGGGNLPGLTSKCLGRVVPSGQPSTGSNRACHAEAGKSSGTFEGPPRTAGPRRWWPLPLRAPRERVDRGRLAAGQRPRGHETRPGGYYSTNAKDVWRRSARPLG